MVGRCSRKHCVEECKWLEDVQGNSVLKSVNGWKMSRKATNCKFSIKSFSGAKIKDMNDYIKPALQENPNHFILHIETNDIPNAS